MAYNAQDPRYAKMNQKSVNAFDKYLKGLPTTQPPQAPTNQRPKRNAPKQYPPAEGYNTTHTGRGGRRTRHVRKNRKNRKATRKNRKNRKNRKATRKNRR